MNALRDDGRKTTAALLLSIVLHGGLLLTLSIVGVLPPPEKLIEPFPLYLGPVGPAGGVGAESGVGAPAPAAGGAPPKAAMQPEPEPAPVHEPEAIVLVAPAPKPKPPEATKKPKPAEQPAQQRETVKREAAGTTNPPSIGEAVGEGDTKGPGDESGTALGARGGPGGGGAGAGGTAAYEQVLAAWLDRHKYYPSSLRRRGIEGEGKLGIRITRAGKVVDVTVLARFSHPSLEPIARDWVKRSEPFPPMPGALGGESYLFAVPVVFRLE